MTPVYSTNVKVPTKSNSHQGVSDCRVALGIIPWMVQGPREGWTMEESDFRRIRTWVVQNETVRYGPSEQLRLKIMDAHLTPIMI